MNADELEAIADEGERASRLAELNVIQQTLHLAQTDFIQEAARTEQRPRQRSSQVNIHLTSTDTNHDSLTIRLVPP